MAVNYSCDFNLNDCIRTLGLNKGGRVQQVVTEQVLQLSETYIPFDQGDLMASGDIIENDTVVVWDTPYAQYMWNGILYVDEETGSPFAPKYAEKVPTDKKLEYHNGNLRSSKWVERMLQNGGLEKIEQAARNAMKE